MKTHKKFLLPFILLGFSTSPIFAGTTTSILQVSATAGTGAGGSCTVIAGSLNFGDYNGSELTTSSTITADCGGASIPWTVELDGGNSTDPNNRQLVGTNPSNTINYQVYNDSGHFFPFIPGNSFGGNGDQTPLPYFFGLIPAGQTPADDDYSDTLIVTVTF